LKKYSVVIAFDMLIIDYVRVSSIIASIFGQIFMQMEPNSARCRLLALLPILNTSVISRAVLTWVCKCYILLTDRTLQPRKHIHIAFRFLCLDFIFRWTMQCNNNFWIGCLQSGVMKTQRLPNHGFFLAVGVTAVITNLWTNCSTSRSQVLQMTSAVTSIKREPFLRFVKLRSLLVCPGWFACFFLIVHILIERKGHCPP
jgi:hypothetical protein